MTQPSYRTLQGVHPPTDIGGARTQSWLRSHAAELSIAVGFLLLSLLYNGVTPLWEPDNEWSHYRYVRYIAVNGTLPPPARLELRRDDRGRFVAMHWPEMEDWQFSQPPLYYLLLSPLLRVVDIGDDLHPDPNLFGFTGRLEDGANWAVHGPEEAFPYRGTVLAVHLLRLTSSFFGLLTVLAALQMGHLLWPNRRHLALTCMAVVAFIPAHLYTSNAINNDSLAFALSSWTAVLAVSLFLSPRKRTLLLLPVCFGLAVLTKTSALALLPMTVLVLLIDLWRRVSHRRFAGLLAGSSLLVVAAGALLLLRSDLVQARFNRQLAAAVSDLQALAGLRLDLSWAAPERALTALRYAYDTFWLIFGAGRDIPWRAPYLLLEALGIAVLLGLGLAIRQPRIWPRRATLLLGLSVLLGVLIPFYRTLRMEDGAVIYGRYLLVLIVPLAALLIIGLGAWWPSHPERPGQIMAGLAVALALWMLPYTHS